MPIANLNIPAPPNTPIGLSPFSAVPTTAQVAALYAVAFNNPTTFPTAGLYTFAVTISDAAMKTLSVTPVQLLAACGVGFTWQLIQVGWSAVITNNGGTGVNGTVRYRGGTPDPRTAAAAATMLAVVAGTTTRASLASASTFNTQVAGDSIENVSLDIIGSANAGAAFATSTPYKVFGIALRQAL